MRSLLLAYSLSFVVFCSLFSCRGDMGEELFSGMDSLLEWHTDSAYKKLQAMKLTIDSINDKRVSMKYYLLCTCAENKLDMQLPPDTVLADVTKYFDEYGTPNERMMATYLRASACRDRKEIPNAVKLFKEAASCADTLSSDCDYLTLSHVYGQMADLLYYQILPDYSIESFKKSAHYALLANDYYGYIRAIELQVQPLAQLEDTAAVLEITDSAYNLFMEYGMPQSAARVFPTAIDMYLGRKDYAKAKELMEIFDRESGLYDDNGEVEKGYRKIHFAKGVISLNDDSLPTAEQHFRKLVSYGMEPYGYAGLGALFTRLGQTDSIMKYTILRDKALDSLAVGYSGQSAAQAYVMFDQDKTNALEKEDFIRTLVNQLMDVESRLNTITNEFKYIKITTSAEIFKLRDYLKTNLNEKNVDQYLNIIVSKVKVAMPNFHEHLTKGNRLSSKEMLVAILLCLDFTTSEIAVLMKSQKSRISNIKHIINNKIFDGSSTDLVESLKALCS